MIPSEISFCVCLASYKHDKAFCIQNKKRASSDTSVLARQFGVGGGNCGAYALYKCIPKAS